MVSQISYCITRPYDDVFVCFITTIVASRIFSIVLVLNSFIFRASSHKR